MFGRAQKLYPFLFLFYLQSILATTHTHHTHKGTRRDRRGGCGRKGEREMGRDPPNDRNRKRKERGKALSRSIMETKSRRTYHL